MAHFFEIHPDNPQARLIRQAVSILKRDGLIVYPTDSGYAFGCQLSSKAGLERIRKIRMLDKHHNFTLICSDLSGLGHYAQIPTPYFRMIKALLPGAYTFIFKGQKQLSKIMMHPNKRTIGLRVPEHKVVQSLIEAMGEPIISSSLLLPAQSVPLAEPQAIFDVLGKHVDLIIDSGYCGAEPTTVVDLTQEKPEVVRVGKGDPAPFLED